MAFLVLKFNRYLVMFLSLHCVHESPSLWTHIFLRVIMAQSSIIQPSMPQYFWLLKKKILLTCWQTSHNVKFLYFCNSHLHWCMIRGKKRHNFLAQCYFYYGHFLEEVSICKCRTFNSCFLFYCYLSNTDQGRCIP